MEESVPPRRRSNTNRAYSKLQLGNPSHHSQPTKHAYYAYPHPEPEPPQAPRHRRRYPDPYSRYSQQHPDTRTRTPHSPNHIPEPPRHIRDPSALSVITFLTCTDKDPQTHSLHESRAGTSKISKNPSQPHSRSRSPHPISFDSQFSPFPYTSKHTSKQTHPLLVPPPTDRERETLKFRQYTTTSEEEHSDIPSPPSTFPHSAFRAPDKLKRREKNVSFLEHQFESIYSQAAETAETGDPFTTTTKPRETIPQVTPLRPNYTTYNSSMTKFQESNQVKGEEHTSPNRKHVISSGSNGVEVSLSSENTDKNGPYSMIVRSERPPEGAKKKSDGSDGDKNDTPPREKTNDKGKKVTVITPQEGQNHGHSRSPSYNTVDFHADIPSVPDSPYGMSPFPQHPGYSTYPSSHPPSFQFPPSPSKSSIKSPKRERASEDHPSQFPYSPHYGYHYPPTSYEESYRDMSPGKRQRVSAESAENDYMYSNSREAHGNYPVDSDHYSNHESYNRYFNRPNSGNKEYYSESFDSETGKLHGVAPPVSKASSYPPAPSSPSRFAAPPESSSSSYPGAHRAQETGADYAHTQGHQYPRHAPPVSYQYEYHDGYYPDAMPRSRHHEMPTPSGHSRQHYPGYYHYEAQAPPDEEHPFFRDHDAERDRRPAPRSHAGMVKREAEKQFSPDRASTKADGESVATTPSLKSRTSKANSPAKRKPSTAAKAAIAAGMTQPQAASEIDFDIHNPPLEPVTPPSKEAVCSLASNVNNDDVLCGRGGGTNTQIGNRKFRALVQEFQPTYLLCRRKEKPLIARTIVLIIRNRGGRFLKKDDGNGMLFEVGDEKAEAKTSQALREGLDVRASKSTTLMGRKQKRAAEKKKKQQTSGSSSNAAAKTAPQSDDIPMSDSPLRSQRDPPPQHDYSQYPPPPYFYGYGAQYPPFPYGYEPNPAYSSPSRKRQRSPHAEAMYYPPATPYGHKGYPPYPYPPDYHYPNYPPTSSQPHSEPGEENAMWESDFNPPRGPTKTSNDMRLKGEQ